MIGLEAEVHVEQAVETLAEQSCAHQQHHRYRELRRPRGSTRAVAKDVPPEPREPLGQSPRATSPYRYSKHRRNRKDQQPPAKQCTAAKIKNARVQPKSIQDTACAPSMSFVEQPHQKLHRAECRRRIPIALATTTSSTPSVMNWRTSLDGDAPQRAAHSDLAATALRNAPAAGSRR